jgi:hypothetical protein
MGWSELAAAAARWGVVMARRRCVGWGDGQRVDVSRAGLGLGLL